MRGSKGPIAGYVRRRIGRVASGRYDWRNPMDGDRALAHPQHAAPVTLPDGEIRPVTRAPGVERYSWALYDFANTTWSMNIVSLYFATWIVVDLGASNATYSWATAISSILMALSVPILGAISDARRRRKSWVVWF